MTKAALEAQLEASNVHTADLYADHPPIDADDATIAGAVAEAEIPALLAALALVNADPGLLSDALKPPLPPMGARIAPQGA